MAGTLATYQGWPCRDVKLRRTRGWRADTSTVLFFARDFPQGFQFVTPAPGDLLRPRTAAPVDLAALRGGRTPVPVPGARRLEFSGALVLAEADRLGNQFVVVVDPLFCVSLETVRRNADGSLAVVLARLVDARYFHAQGFVRRWSFNRADAEGRYALDSVKPTGEPFTLAEIASETARSVFGSPALAHVPERWGSIRPAVELPRFSPASTALARLAQEHGAGELCLNFDGSVALWGPGEGRLGYAPEGRGANSQDLPAHLLLDLGGAGQTQGVEATYPPDFVLVVGGLRIASVRLDDLEPVLVIEGTPVPLSEETVRKLTGGRYGLAWLAHFVLAPQAYQHDVGLDPRVTALLREQAYRLWRLPGLEVDEPFREAPGPTPGPSAPGALPSFEQGMAGLRRESAGAPNRVRGPNARLLPLLDRAEIAAGRRLPVRVDSYRFTSVHRAMAPSKDAETAAGVLRRLAELRHEIHGVARARGKPDPFDAASAHFLFDERYLSSGGLRQLLGDLTPHGITHEELARAVDRARLLERIREVNPGHAQQYEQELGRLVDLDAAAVGPGKALQDLAREVVELERAVSESRSAFETPDEEALERAAELRQKLQDELRALDRRQEENRRRTRVGAARAATEQTAVFVRNLPRDLDPGARVFSAELGIVQTSDLSGHVAEEGVPVAEATHFVPRPPLVTFGAVLRPDAVKRRPVTGGGASETVIPPCLSDQESYYTAAFRRTPAGRAEPVDVAAVPQGQGVPIERPDLVELVPLEGSGNRAALDETARAIAEGVFGRPDRVEAAKVSVARPWPVNCDGVVAGVEIAMRPNGKGFVTTIHLGSDAPALKPLDRTRVRVRRGAPSDAAAREGLLP